MKILQIAGYGKNFGSGHFVRQSILHKMLHELGHESEIVKIENENDILKINLEPYDVIIKDSRDSNKKIDKFLDNKIVITFDDYYNPDTYRGYRFFYNAIPSLKDFGNIKSLSYLIIQDIKKKENNSKIYDIFVTFGNLDPYKLSDKIEKIFVLNFDKIKDKSICFVLPENIYEKIFLIKDRTIYKNFDIIKAGNENYYNLLLNAKIIITHFGLTFFESLKLNKNIILVSPTTYHEKLSFRFFNDIHVCKNLKINERRLFHLIEFYNEENLNINKGIFNIKNQDICNFDQIKNFIKNQLNFIANNKDNFNELCPICKKNNKKIIYLDEKYHLLICKNCKLLIKENLNFEPMNEDSGEKYYFEEYKKIYGKTYLEDRENISRFNKSRLNLIIPKLNKSKDIKAIDFGGALGFFLDDLKDELQKNGKKLNGFIIETNSFALNYVEKKGYIGLSKIENIKEENFNTFDLITFWFCLEHLKDFDRKINFSYKLLKKGGLLCFSFPSIFGPSFFFKKNREEYFKIRPVDHYYDFNPFSFSNFLEKVGFKVCNINIPTIHYERFEKAKPYFAKLLGKKFFEKISRKIKFGDICEIYAIKK